MQSVCSVAIFFRSSSVSTLLRILTANCVAGGQAKKAREKMKREGVIDDEEVSTASGVQKKHDIFSKLSNREIEFYQEVFEKIDVDGSGEIDDQEVLPPPPQLPALQPYIRSRI